jgi:hypothetical protein
MPSSSTAVTPTTNGDLSPLLAAAFGPDRAAEYGKQLQSFLAEDPRDYNFTGTITA